MLFREGRCGEGTDPLRWAAENAKRSQRGRRPPHSCLLWGNYKELFFIELQRNLCNKMK